MSETQKHNPEASVQQMADLYMEAANYLETALHYGEAVVEPEAGIADYMLRVSTDVPALNGKHLKLQYDRPKREDDPTQVDRDIPLAFIDDEGRNQWQTPINVAVYDENDTELHDYSIEYIGGDWARVVDETLQQPGQDTDEYGSITALDAQELTAHLNWALGNDVEVSEL